MDKLCKQNSVLNQIRQRYTPGEIQELRFDGDVCLLCLRTGHLFLASLDRRGNLRLEELEAAC
ncbi:MAG: hypothetical protein K2P20_04085 [Oscillospiraceae bacterium]|nr:hypothetical protein [Oscillospiraceae bacterium]